jgi:hypothetical protein
VDLEAAHDRAQLCGAGQERLLALGLEHRSVEPEVVGEEFGCADLIGRPIEVRSFQDEPGA